ncbi:MAG TPA: SDR family oxidoreductase [Phycisphaerales bacterium]|nr:SDR family oxidoreductase [Phycisphaerales bacterium]
MPTALVTGASRGIGLELASRLHAGGWRVLATARAPGRPDGLRDIAEVIRLDVADDASVADLGRQLGGVSLDLLVNNAGVSSPGKRLADLDGPELARVFRVNAIAPLLVTRAALPALRAGGRKQIVNISSQLGSIAGNTGGSSYAYRGSKAALNMLTVCMAHELRPEGFTAVTMHPGWVRTDMGGPEAPLTPAQSARSMLEVLERLTPSDTGRFLNYDGSPLPW